MALNTSAFETGHEQMIHDVQMDYYGKRLATASSDRTIKIFEIQDNQQNLVAHLRGHDGPVWQVAWAHPKFGSLLASCSYDGKVAIWKEQQQNQWAKIFEDSQFQSSVNSVCWAPHTLGLLLAAASADGTVAILSYQDNGQWSRQSIPAHNNGCTAVSWGPDLAAGSLLKQGQQQGPRSQQRFVTAGCDNRVRVWGWNGEQNQWVEEKFANDDNRHNDWVRDAAWAPSVGLANTIATCSEDKTVIIWTEKGGMWRKAHVLPFKHNVWKVSWSVMGNILAVSQGDNKVSLWKESIDGGWQNLSEIAEAGVEKKEQQQQQIPQKPQQPQQQ
jgi:protein transport protein SEC13